MVGSSVSRVLQEIHNAIMLLYHVWTRFYSTFTYQRMNGSSAQNFLLKHCEDTLRIFSTRLNGMKHTRCTSTPVAGTCSLDMYT